MGDDWPSVGEIVASHMAAEQEDDGPYLAYMIEGQERCTNCGERYLFLTSRPYVPGMRAEKGCPDCGTVCEHVITVMYEPDEYDLVDAYGDGKIGLRSTCEDCGTDYHGPMLRPCYECGSKDFDRWLDAEAEAP